MMGFKLQGIVHILSNKVRRLIKFDSNWGNYPSPQFIFSSEGTTLTLFYLNYTVRALREGVALQLIKFDSKWGDGPYFIEFENKWGEKSLHYSAQRLAITLPLALIIIMFKVVAKGSI